MSNPEFRIGGEKYMDHVQAAEAFQGKRFTDPQQEYRTWEEAKGILEAPETQE